MIGLNFPSGDCPHCNVHAQMHWSEAYRNGGGYVSDLMIASCTYCRKMSLWVGEEMIYPAHSVAAQPHPEMPTELKADFEEARQIVAKSPRGAAALLRLVVQKLMKALGQPGKDINQDIADLVKAGLPIQIQEALDVVRVVGNESVHPGELNLQDTPDVAEALFELINLIVDNRIAEPKRVKEIFNKLPASKRAAIQKRDT